MSANTVVIPGVADLHREASQLCIITKECGRCLLYLINIYFVTSRSQHQLNELEGIVSETVVHLPIFLCPTTNIHSIQTFTYPQTYPTTNLYKSDMEAKKKKLSVIIVMSMFNLLCDEGR